MNQFKPKVKGFAVYKERNEALYNDFLTGMTYNQLAKKYDLSRQRVNMLVRKMAYRLSKQLEKKS